MKTNMKDLNVKRIISEQKALSALIVIAIFMLILKPSFFSGFNILTILKSASVLMIIGFGEALVIISGGVDLSVGGIMCLSGVVIIRLMDTMPMPAALLLAVGSGALVGFINGFLSVHQKTEPFVITLGMGLALTGICLQLSGGRPIYASKASFGAFGNSSLLGVPTLIWCMLAVMAIMYYLIRYTQFGRSCYAIGGDYEIAVYSGINALKIQWSAYVISGILAALGGVLLSSRLNSGSATYGGPTALYVCCCVVLGGTSFSGGTGGMIRTAIGILLFSTLDNALPMFSAFSANVYLQQLIKGALVVIVVGIEYYSKKLKRERV